MVVHDSEKELEDGTIPTWAPRWNTLDKTSARPVALISTYEYRQMPYRASMGSLPFSPIFASPDILSIMGWKFDTVAWVSSKLVFVDIQGNVEDWKPHLGDSNILPIEPVWLELLEKSSTSPDELIWYVSLTLARGRPASKDYVDDLLLYCETLRRKAGTKTASPFPQRKDESGSLLNAERSFPRATDRRLAMTSRGRMALAPLIDKIDDSCCIIQGMDVPIVLREMENGTYQCIGETYCSGVMEGELMTAKFHDNPHWEELHVK
ncbi:hypothetical protein IL306_012744 [Fusarium sp. DS 682]|nr:hypothetical protein IL306_012744 [Fusarium sp. DS 682]